MDANLKDSKIDEQKYDIDPPSNAYDMFTSITNKTFVYEVNKKISSENEVNIVTSKRVQRVLCCESHKNIEEVIDKFEDGSVCKFTRIPNHDKEICVLHLTGNYDVIRARNVGYLFKSRDGENPHFWLPIQPVARKYDKFGLIVSEKNITFNGFSILSTESSTVFNMPKDNFCTEFVVWTLPLNSYLVDEILTLSLQEQQNIFLWGSHTKYSGLEDLYKNLIHGAIFKAGMPWTEKPFIRSYCEVVAQSLYVTFHGLWKITGKKIYQHMKSQLVFSVIARQEEDGAWRHGSWTDDFEVHYRHHCSGIHMLAADFEETKDPVVGSSLKRAVDFMRNQCDELSIGNWYLHDSLELSEESMRKSPVKYQYSRVLGKSPSNMLVLNTHLDALVALKRYNDISGQSCLEREITSGVKAAVAVLRLNSAETLYRVLFKSIELTFLSNSIAKNMSLPVRAIRRMAREKLIPLLPRIKKMFPRIVMPNGYIDRNLSLNEFWYPYFLINVMDLLRFQMRFRVKMVDPIIDNAVRFIERVGLERWLSNESTAYAVGFWAEALYLYCLRRPDRSRAALADTTKLLYASKQGIPPSFLGCNSEYIAFNDQVPCMWTDNGQLLIINLSLNPDKLEFLLVNSTNSPQLASIPHKYKKLMVFDQNGNSISTEQILTVPSLGWIQLVSPQYLTSNE